MSIVIGGNSVVYLAHPVSGWSEYDLHQSGCAWLPVLVKNHPSCAFCMPWFTYVMALDDSDQCQRERGMRDDKMIMHRCDALWLLGRTVSGGMISEAREMSRSGKAVFHFDGEPEHHTFRLWKEIPTCPF